MRTQVNLLFYLKKRAAYKSGPVAIYLRFTVEGNEPKCPPGKPAIRPAGMYRRDGLMAPKKM
jgi:hypothetical protein